MGYIDNFNLVLALLVLATCFSFSPVLGMKYLGPNLYAGEVEVYVNNLIAPNILLYNHCKSKENDLGLQKVAYGHNQTWSFRVNFFATTLYWCNMYWFNDMSKSYVQGGFQIYKATRDYDKCDGNCVRNVKREGLCFFNPDQSDIPPKFMFAWPKKSIIGIN
ncbi:hypothetical protein IFM89_009657 [Coptis chinensis]|uniref:S-protein homolog n=1 Tax=Coptis chinensis TaxID=261450 RepID=A0A835IL80_9MAGN|nr:hypothetical protein IFM89_009657 [Coptis chinensis]